MGMWEKIAAGAVGLLLIGGPLWPVALVCFAYLALTLSPKSARGDSDTRWPGGRVRHLLASALFAASALAYASGGTLSPTAFFLGGAVALFWPWFDSLSLARQVAPVEDSIAFRSKHFPFIWHALGELKPGSDPFPRALSSFSGTLLVITESGRAYTLATCFALGRKRAEAELNGQLRASAPRARSGGLLFPLDSAAACDVFRWEYSRIRLPSADLARTVTSVSGILVLRCARESVREAGAYEIRGKGDSATLPGCGRALGRAPLVWEVLEGVGRRTRWPGPDSCSSLLDSLNATRGVPLGDRLKAIEGTGSEVSLQSLGGAEVRVTRPQLRALVSIYS